MLRALRPSLTVLSTLLIVSLHGCMVGPDYERPDLVTPDRWHSQLVEGIEESEGGSGLWWQEFEDPILDTLIHRAQTNNLDLRTMMTRVDFARAEYGIDESYSIPQIMVCNLHLAHRICRDTLMLSQNRLEVRHQV